MVASSEGERQARINVSEGERQEAINLSEAEKLRQINEAEGRAEEIRLIAEATAAGVRAVAAAVSEPGGKDAINLRVAEQWVKEFGKLAQANNTMIVPAQLGDVSTLVSTVWAPWAISKNPTVSGLPCCGCSTDVVIPRPSETACLVCARSLGRATAEKRRRIRCAA